jgi:DNA-binding response OmpR family regulator
MKTNILIVDDDREIAQAIAFYLRNEGYEPLIALDGIEALDLIRSTPVSLIIMDVMMPGLDGIQTTLRIREEHNIPIIMLSAKSEDYDKITGLNVGADDYMTKPFSPSELVARVKAHLARYERLVSSGKPSNDIIEVRGIKIDKTARRVFVNGEEKAFTTKEFDLLTFLAENPNHVFTKDELFKEIWDMDSIGDIATVTVHIKKIREKIEYDTSKPQYIETIWGVGYRFKM